MPPGGRRAPAYRKQPAPQKSVSWAQMVCRLGPAKQGSRREKGSCWPRRVGANDALRERAPSPRGKGSLGSHGIRGHVICYSSKQIHSHSTTSAAERHECLCYRCQFWARWSHSSPLPGIVSGAPSIPHAPIRAFQVEVEVLTWGCEGCSKGRKSARSRCRVSQLSWALSPPGPCSFSPSLGSVVSPVTGSDVSPLYTAPLLLS